MEACLSTRRSRGPPIDVDQTFLLPDTRFYWRMTAERQLRVALHSSMAVDIVDILVDLLKFSDPLPQFVD